MLHKISSAATMILRVLGCLLGAHLALVFATSMTIAGLVIWPWILVPVWVLSLFAPQENADAVE